MGNCCIVWAWKEKIRHISERRLLLIADLYFSLVSSSKFHVGKLEIWKRLLHQATVQQLDCDTQIKYHSWVSFSLSFYSVVLVIVGFHVWEQD